MVSNDFSLLGQSKTHIGTAFDMVDLGPIKSCLGLQVDRDDTTIRLHQAKYISELLDKYQMSKSKTQPTPLGLNVKLLQQACPQTQSERNSMARYSYASLVGSLMYLAYATRPDISYVVSVLGQFMSNPGRSHWNATNRVLRYLKGTMDYALVYNRRHIPSNEPRLIAYTDADWGGCPNTSRSTSGACFFMDKSLISWYSKKQHCVAVSTTEAKYVAASMASRELIWLQRLLQSFQQISQTPALLYCDNQSAISLTKDDVFHSKSKHIAIHYHYVKLEVKKQTIMLQYCPTDKMIADIFTKPLSTSKHEDFTSQLRILP